MIVFSIATESLEMYCAVGTQLAGRANNLYEKVIEESIKLIYVINEYILITYQSEVLSPRVELNFQYAA